MGPRGVRTVLVLLGVTALVAACGGPSPDPPPSPTVVTPAAAPEVGAVDVVGDDLPAYDPTELLDSAVGLPAPLVIGTGPDGDSVAVGAGGVPSAVLVVAHWSAEGDEQLAVLTDLLGEGAWPSSVLLQLVSTAADPDLPDHPPSRWLEDAGLGEAPTLLDDAEGTAARALGAVEVPTWVLLDADGWVVERAGLLDAAELALSVDLLVAGDEPEPSPEPSPEPEPEPAAGLETIVGLPVDDPQVNAVLDRYACRIDWGLMAGGGVKCVASGIGLSVSTGLLVSSVFLYADGVDGYSEFTDDLPMGLAWGKSRDSVQAQLGTPVRSGEITMYDAYVFDVYQPAGQSFVTLTLEYDSVTGGLRKVTMTDR